MKVVRILVYEGDRAWIERTISSSLPQGKVLLGGDNSVTSILPDNWDTEKWMNDTADFFVGHDRLCPLVEERAKHHGVKKLFSSEKNHFEDSLEL